MGKFVLKFINTNNNIVFRKWLNNMCDYYNNNYSTDWIETVMTNSYKEYMEEIIFYLIDKGAKVVLAQNIMYVMITPEIFTEIYIDTVTEYESYSKLMIELP
jgi:hypothetical protein